MINSKTKFLIVGLGLIGGAYSCKLHEHNYEVKAIDISQSSLDYALNKQWISEGAKSATKELLQWADVIISALYPQTLINWVRENAPLFKEHTIITDASGVKEMVCQQIDLILKDYPTIEFIGCHPMAGKETSGIEYAQQVVFNQANFIITPLNNSDQVIETMKELGRILGFGNISLLTPAQHDKMVGFVSQLTHVIAVSLMNTSDNHHLKEYTGDSFRDLTRIANINEKLWPELFILNKDNLVNEIDSFVQQVEHLKQAINDENVEEMERLFIQSTKRRKYFDK